MNRERFEEGTSSHYRDPRYYNQAYRSRRGDIACYLQAAREWGDPVLELGVGTGRIASRLAKEGFAVVGIDRMSTMLADCERRLQRAGTQALVTLHEDDFRSFALAQKFPLAIAPFNAFMHLYEVEDVMRSLGCVRDHLVPGGRLLFDVLMPDLTFLNETPANPYRGDPVSYPGKKGQFWYTESFAYDEIAQIQWITISFIDTRDPDHKWQQRIAHRYFFPQEIRALIRGAGFELEAIYGNYRRGKLRPGSDIMLCQCRKPKP